MNVNVISPLKDPYLILQHFPARAVARYQTKRSELKNAPTALTTVPQGAPPGQILVARMIQTVVAAATLRATAEAAADRNRVRIVKTIVCIQW